MNKYLKVTGMVTGKVYFINKNCIRYFCSSVSTCSACVDSGAAEAGGNNANCSKCQAFTTLHLSHSVAGKSEFQVVEDISEILDGLRG